MAAGDRTIHKTIEHHGYLPEKCPFCPRTFSWGFDEDSPLGAAAGRNKACGGNAFWKLTGHMNEAHPGPEGRHTCGRRHDNFGMQLTEQPQDFYHDRSGLPVCSYCGSLSPEKLFELIELGCEIGPTDKSYKIYVYGIPNPIAGQEVYKGGESGPAFGRNGEPSKPDLSEQEIANGRYDRITVGPAPATTDSKFYFQHFSEADITRFIDLYNNKKIKMGAPGHFYVTPFFAQRAVPKS